MIKFMDYKKYIKTLKPITSIDIFTKTGDFHPEGLFSEIIFGPVGSSKERRGTFSYIDLNAYIIHPTAYKLLIQLDRKIEKFISTEETFSLNQKNELEITPNSGVTGINEFIKLFPSIKFRGETEGREKIIKLLNDSYKDGNLFVNIIPVIPPDLRPANQDQDGNWIIDTLNDIYTNIMKRSFQVKSSGSGPLYDLLNYTLQKSVLEHDEFIKTKIQKKSGIVREQMLGKRVDFSARAVITPGPELNADEIGLPFRMAVKLFEPFILHHLLYTKAVNKEILERLVKEHTEQELSVDSVKKVIVAIKSNDKMNPDLYELFFEVTQIVMKDRLILAKRDPVLQRDSYRAYIPILVRGNTLQLSTMRTGGHNADFDGDSYNGNINIYVNDNKVKMHIKDFENSNLIYRTNNKIKDNGIEVIEYKIKDDVDIDIKVQAIDPNTGNVMKKKITDFSVHKNIDMYKISDKQNRFEEFHASYDHSLIIYDENLKEIRKVSPRELLENREGKYLIQRQVE